MCYIYKVVALIDSGVFLQGELADFIDAQVRESQTKKTFDALKNKVHGLAVSFLQLQSDMK